MKNMIDIGYGVGSPLFGSFNLDMPEGGYQLGFQDPASPVMVEIINFHNYIMTYLIFVVFGVL